MPKLASPTHPRETFFVENKKPFASPLPNEPDPCGVSVYEWDTILGRFVLAGSMHARHARDIYGWCPIHDDHPKKSTELPTPYTLTLTPEEVRTIGFVGHRYCWSVALGDLDVGTNALTETDAWVLVGAFEADTLIFRCSTVTAISPSSCVCSWRRSYSPGALRRVGPHFF
jgi:hypothetical protein